MGKKIFYKPALNDHALEVLHLIKKNNSFLITSHIGLDGDALGSELALARILKKMGKKVQILNDSAIPLAYQFLPGVEKIRSFPQTQPAIHDAVIILDIGKFDRAGTLKNTISLKNDTIINIDHHKSNKGFGTASLIDSSISSTGELLFEFFKWAGLPVDKTTALLLYVSILTDTGRFTYDNTGAQTHKNIGELLETGKIRTNVVASRIYRNLTCGQMELYKRALQSLTYTKNKKIAYITL
ncbi:MAG: DHH family phosphoesterase, partial [Planctomycetota bacterium]